MYTPNTLNLNLHVWGSLSVNLMFSENVDVHIELRAIIPGCGSIRRQGPNLTFLKHDIELTRYL